MAYPTELTDLFGSLECRLCGVEVTGPIVAKMHYSGKQHMKKVNNFLSQWSLRTGCQLPEFEVESISPESSLADYCKICDLKLFSVNEKLLHYSSKTHKKNENGPPKTKKSKMTNNAVDLASYFGIDSDFSNDITEDGVKVDMDQRFVCNLCDVKAISLDQLKSHLYGRKHRENLAKRDSRKEKQDKSFVCKDRSVIKTEHDDLQNKWVCLICHTMVFDSEQELNEHKSSRKHLLCVLNQENGDTVIDELRYCFVCRKQYRNDKDYTDHLFGQKHMTLSNEQVNLETKTDLFRCTVCDTVMDEEEKKKHLKDEKHLRQSIKTDSLNFLAKLAHEDIATNLFRCSNCDVTLNCFVKYSEHLLSNRHMDQMIRESTNKIS